VTEPPRYRRVLFTGSQTWDDAATIAAALGPVWHPDTVLVVGDASGADQLATWFWTARNAEAGAGQPPEVHKAKWGEFGRAAGHVRNVGMVAYGADLCIACIRDGSPGATDCLGLARLAGIPVDVHVYGHTQ
jgi:hypothetical protein